MVYFTTKCNFFLNPLFVPMQRISMLLSQCPFSNAPSPLINAPFDDMMNPELEF
jgi:hypothetical protein